MQCILRPENISLLCFWALTRAYVTCFFSFCRYIWRACPPPPNTKKLATLLPPFFPPLTRVIKPVFPLAWCDSPDDVIKRVMEKSDGLGLTATMSSSSNWARGARRRLATERIKIMIFGTSVIIIISYGYVYHFHMRGININVLCFILLISWHFVLTNVSMDNAIFEAFLVHSFASLHAKAYVILSFSVYFFLNTA